MAIACTFLTLWAEWADGDNDSDEEDAADDDSLDAPRCCCCCLLLLSLLLPLSAATVAALGNSGCAAATFLPGVGVLLADAPECCLVETPVGAGRADAFDDGADDDDDDDTPAAGFVSRLLAAAAAAAAAAAEEEEELAPAVFSLGLISSKSSCLGCLLPGAV